VIDVAAVRELVVNEFKELSLVPKCSGNSIAVSSEGYRKLMQDFRSPVKAFLLRERADDQSRCIRYLDNLLAASVVEVKAVV
jgi:hypothetical protein